MFQNYSKSKDIEMHSSRPRLDQTSYDNQSLRKLIESKLSELDEGNKGARQLNHRN